MEDEEVRAPINSAPFRGRESSAGQASFGAYFLRDLWTKGLIDRGLLAELVEANKLEVPLDDVVEALENRSGKSIPRNLADHIETLAELTVANN